MTQNNRGWNLDRNLSVGMIAAVLFQAGAFIWFGAKLDSRVIAVEEADKVAAASQRTLEGKIDDIGSRLVRIETILEMNFNSGNEPVKER